MVAVDGGVATSGQGAAVETVPGAVAVPRGYPGPLASLLAKTARPLLIRGGVDRQRLFDLLDKAVLNPVTVVRAGAGWGKTVLVSAWAQTRPGPVAWLSLDRHDNDPQIFWAYVVAALRSAGAVTSENPLAEMGSVPRDERERGLRIAAGLSRLPVRTVLVIDDFHEIDDRQVLDEVDDLLRHPSAVRLVLISRTEPPLALHRLRAADQVAEIRADDLAFTGDEAAALVGGHGLTLGPDEVTLLVKLTDGWAAGLQLGAGFLAGDQGARSVADFVGNIRAVEGYLHDEVLAGRPPRQRRFLLETSICEHLCADLANAITSASDGQRMLEELERDSGFVVRLGPTPHWFRYHHLLRDMLGHRLNLEMPADVPELHRRAARWYVDNNLLVEALTHAVQARDWAYTGRLVMTRVAPLILSTQRAALVRILQQVPREQLTSTPELMMCDVLQIFEAGEYDAIPARVARIRELLRDRPDVTRDPAEVLLLTLQAAADRIVGDMPALVAVANEMLTLLAGSPFHDGAAFAQYRAIARNARGMALMWTGRLDAAARDLREASGAAMAAGVELPGISAVGHLALLEVMHGSVRAAAELAGSARDLAERRAWGYTLQAVAAHFAQALVHIEGNDLAAAEEALRRGRRAHEGDPEPAQRLVMLGVRARLALAHGQPARARSLLAEARRDRGARVCVPLLDQWLMLLDAEIDLAVGRPARAEQRYAEFLPTEAVGLAHRAGLARAALARRDLRRAEELLIADPTTTLPETVATVEAGIVGALVADERGHTTRAVDLLADAVGLATREGIRRPFITMSGSRLVDLFDRLRLLDPDHASLAADIINEVRTANGPAPDTSGGLTEREAQVLRYLPTMLTAAEIAAELSVSVNTVKAHLRSIYRKLGAERRSEAVANARDLGIL
ncbi:LuxR C-terminal-related transcriptional regulator [Actinoplanes sp. KI2]|uniref:LuxR C-terminal-related transcriptional regulator n=1 Tax=Actinoplanes sp. KI2 TaxID=2983315 RepID=UPI0021D60FAE|nr:LuxR C-terminal-related transcriptional regulator [Actinoplanes sp. KI2]MCU7728501.1 LuxR C-terminal-related transcriptional regulator [Actinoplanes sp. KI2]